MMTINEAERLLNGEVTERMVIDAAKEIARAHFYRPPDPAPPDNPMLALGEAVDKAKFGP